MTAPADEDPVQVWLSLPRRIYLDTCTLQAIHKHGDVIWDGEPFVPQGPAERVDGYEQDLQALRLIFIVNERATFEFVVTETTIREVQGRRDRRYIQWVYDVQDTWLIQSEGQEVPRWGHRLYSPTFGMNPSNAAMRKSGVAVQSTTVDGGYGVLLYASW